MGAKKPPAGVHSLINEAGAVTSMAGAVTSMAGAVTSMSDVAGSTSAAELELEPDDEPDAEPDEEPDVVGTPVVAEVEIPAVVE